MKIKLDENLPYCLFDWLSERGYEVDTVLQEGLEGLQDSEVWDAARKGGKFFITQDLDFSDARKFAPGLTRDFCSYGSGIPGGSHWLSGLWQFSRHTILNHGKDALSWSRIEKFECEDLHRDGLFLGTPLHILLG